MPEKADGATGVMAEGGGGRPDWDSEQVGTFPLGGEEGDSVCPVQVVVVPRVSRDSHYYRHSRKRRRGMLIKTAPEEEAEDEVCAPPPMFADQGQLSLSLSLSVARRGTVSSHVLEPYHAPSVSCRIGRITVV